MKKALLLICGWILIGLAALGVVLPVLPTTPFVILAAACFSVGSPEIHRKLESSRLFGPYITNWRTKQGIPRAVKIKSITMLWLLLILSSFLTWKLWLALCLAAVGIGVTIHLLMIKTRKELSEKEQETTQPPDTEEGSGGDSEEGSGESA